MSPVPLILPPSGLQEILASYGDPRDCVREDGTLDPRWERERLEMVTLPLAVPLAGVPGRVVTRARVHRLIAYPFRTIMLALVQRDLARYVQEWGGTFAWRLQRGSASKISTHSWGLALDLNPTTNPRGRAPTMHPGIVELFEESGWVWGGRWEGETVDGMHFQFARGY